MERRDGRPALDRGRRREGEREDVEVSRVLVRVAVGTVLLVVALLAASAWPVGGATGAPAPLSEEERTVVVERAAAVTVAVRSRGCDGAARGSGVLLAGRVVTNRHLTDGATDLTVLAGRGAGSALVGAASTGGHGGALPVTARSADLDLAATAAGVAPVGDDPLRLAGRDPIPGEPVILGADYGEGFRHREGGVVGVVDGAAYGFAAPVLLVDVPTVPGFSGGPVLDRDGELLGVLAAVDTTTALSLAVPASQLSAWLASADDRQADTSCMGGSR